MRYHHEKPSVYASVYGNIYECEHPVYNKCTLFKIDQNGLSVIQQRYDNTTKKTWWGEIDPWLTDPIYLHPKFMDFSMYVLINPLADYIQQLLYDKSCGL